MLQPVTMEAVILSGGFGTRLRPLTYTRPKPLIPVANKPMIGHILGSLPDEVDRAVLAAGYRIEDLQAWAEALDHRVELVVVEETEPLGTGGAIKNVEDELTGPFLCFNGDVLASTPLSKMVSKREKAQAMGVISLWQVDDPSAFGVVALDGDRITRFVEKPEPGQAPSDLINAGTYCFDHAILDHIPSGRKVSLEREIYPALLEQGETLLGVPFEGYWVDCGRPGLLLEAHAAILDGELLVGDGARMEGRWEGWACLGDGAGVEAGASLIRSVLLENARVDPGARLEDTIVGQGAEIGEDARLVRCVVGDGVSVAPGADLSDVRLGGDVDIPAEQATAATRGVI